MVGLTEISDPGDGIGEGVIKRAVLSIELQVGLTAAVDEAVAALNGLVCLAMSSR